MVSLFQYFIYAICFKCFFFLALAFESVRAAFFFFFFLIMPNVCRGVMFTVLSTEKQSDCLILKSYWESKIGS